MHNPASSPISLSIRFDRLVTLVLLAMVVCLYLPALGFDFVNWDDPWYVENNELIRSWHPQNLWRIATEVVARNYAPLTMLSLLIDHTVWADWAGGYHLTNFLLHGLNAALVYLLIGRLGHSRFVGFGTALLFALHPVHIESVAWVSSRKGLLSAAFLLGSLCFWLRPHRTQRDELHGLCLFVLALLTKAIAVVMPPLVLLYDLLVRKQKLSETLPRQVVPGLLACWVLLVTMSAQTTDIGGVRAHLMLSKPHLFAVDAMIVWRYLGMLVWPNELAILYDPPTSGIAFWAGVSIAGWIACGLLVWHLRQKSPLLVLGTAAFWLLLLPVLNLFPITTLMNDRYLYLPCIPAFAGIMAILERVRLRAIAIPGTALCFPTWPRTAVIWLMMIAACAGFTQRSRARLWVWRDGLTLWTVTREQVPQLAVVQIQYANTLHQLGQTGRAVGVLREALAVCQMDEADRRRIQNKLQHWQHLPVAP